MNREISPGIIAAAIAGVIVLIGIVFFVRSRGNAADAKASAARGQASGAQMMQYMQGKNGAAPPAGFDPRTFKPGDGK